MYRKGLKREFYTRKAREEGYPARSVYKLKEIDEKFHIFKMGDHVLDLGCAPGSWLLYVAQKVGENGKVVGIDREDIKIKKEDNIVFIKRDIFYFKNSEIDAFLKKYQVVISDLAPSTSGIKIIDSERSLELSEKALEIAKKVLLPRGNFVCKIFEGRESEKFFKKVEENFGFTKIFRPKAVFKGSKEIFIVAKNFKK